MLIFWRQLANYDMIENDSACSTEKTFSPYFFEIIVSLILLVASGSWTNDGMDVVTKIIIRVTSDILHYICYIVFRGSTLSYIHDR